MRILHLFVFATFAACQTTSISALKGNSFLWDWQKDLDPEIYKLYDKHVSENPNLAENITITFRSGSKVSAPGCNIDQLTYRISNEIIFIGENETPVTHTSCTQLIPDENGGFKEFPVSIRNHLEYYWSAVCETGCTIQRHDQKVLLTNMENDKTVSLLTR